MPWHNEISKTRGMYAPSPDFDYLCGFDKAVAVISNLIARAITRWSLEQSKIFMIAVSQIEKRDKDCWVKMKKKDVLNALGMNPGKDHTLLKKILRDIQDKSVVKFNGPGASDWESGNLIRKVATDRYNIKIQFDEYYLPLLHYVKEQYFTRIDIKSILVLRHKSSYNLYMYLSSWHNQYYSIDRRNINKGDLAKVFNLQEGQYWRNYGTKAARFHWSDFESHCLKPAIKDINDNKLCDMHIDLWEKIKDPVNNWTVIGYRFEWHYVNPDGYYKEKEYKGIDDQAFDYEPFQIADLSHAHSFMRHFKRMSDQQLEELSALLGTHFGLPMKTEYPDWSVDELKQESSQKCISYKFYSDLHTKEFKMSEEERSQLYFLFGYEDGDTFCIDFESVGRWIREEVTLGEDKYLL